jgi:peroxiredoxin
VKSWASSLTGANRREHLTRVGLAVVLLAAVLWALPVRRPGEEGGHHSAHPPVLDPWERAGVTELKEGQRAPRLSLPRLDGGHAALTDYADKLVVLNFWATWCQPCTIEMPTLEALWQQYRNRGLVVLGVSVDRDAPRPLLEPYVRNSKLTFPILLDADLKISQAWRVTGLPATFIIRPGGEVAGLAIGMREWNSEPMRALIETLLPGVHARH